MILSDSYGSLVCLLLSKLCRSRRTKFDAMGHAQSSKVIGTGRSPYGINDLSQPNNDQFEEQLPDDLNDDARLTDTIRPSVVVWPKIAHPEYPIGNLIG